MYIFTQKKWTLKYRIDKDSGRVLFIGPFVINFDVVKRFPNKARD